MAKIQKTKDPNGNITYPVTHSDGVIVAAGTLTDKLATMDAAVAANSAAITTLQANSSSVNAYEKPSTGIPTADMANNAITTAKIADGAVTEAKLDSALANKINDKADVTALNDKANAADVYTKTEVDTALSAKADTLTTYTKAQVNTYLADKADAATTYTKTEVDAMVSVTIDSYTKTESDTLLAAKADTSALALKADASNVYTKAQVDAATSSKANSVDVYTKTQVYTKDEVYTKTETYTQDEVDGLINALDFAAVGGVGKIIKSVSETNGVLAASAVDACTKADTPTVGSAYTYTIGDSATKVEMPKASTTDAGMVVIDEDITEVSGVVTSVNTPTSKAVAEYLNNKLGDLAGAMSYKGTVSSTVSLPSTFSCGDTWVVAEEGTYASTVCTVGSMIIATADSNLGGVWSVVKPTPKVENKDVTLSSGTKATIAIVDGKAITVTPMTVDSAISSTSVNAVQNKVVYEEIEGLFADYDADDTEYNEY